MDRKGCPLTTEGGGNRWRDKDDEIDEMGGRKGVEHESNEVSEQKEDEMLRKYLRMGSQLQR